MHGRGLQVGLLDDDGVAALAGMQGDRITASALSYSLRIDRRGTVLADEPLRGLVVADRTTDLASVEYGGDLAVRLLIEQKPDLGAVYFDGVTVQVAIGNLRFGDGGLPVDESDCSRGRK